MLKLILIEPKKQENLGAIARVMKNFDFKELILINPKCKIGKTAKKVAKHASGVLDKAKIKDFPHLKNFDYLIGTTAILGNNGNIPRNPVDPKQLADKLAKLNKKIKIALIIGREGQGLSNKEIDMCDILVTIPASKIYPTLNISHAVSVILSEIFNSSSLEKSNSHINFATKKEKEIIMEYINGKLKSMDFATKEKLETQKKVWKRLLGKSMMTKREAFALMGFLRKLR